MLATPVAALVARPRDDFRKRDHRKLELCDPVARRDGKRLGAVVDEAYADAPAEPEVDLPRSHVDAAPERPTISG